MDDNFIKIVVAALGSGFFSSFITAQYTKISNDKQLHHNYVTNERKNWREEIRKKATELVSFPSEAAKIEARTFFEVRLNPNDPEDRYILSLIDNLTPTSTNKFSKAISCLLKYDWERVKNETRNTSKPQQLLFYLFIIAFLYHYFYSDIYFFKTWNDTLKNVFSYEIFIFISILNIRSYLIKMIKCLLKKILNNNKQRVIYQFLDIPFRENFSKKYSSNSQTSSNAS